MGNASSCCLPRERCTRGDVKYHLEFVDEEVTTERRFGGEDVEEAATAEGMRSCLAERFRYYGDREKRVQLASNIFIDANEPFIDLPEDAEDGDDEASEMTQGTEGAASVLSRPPGDSLNPPVIEGEIYTGRGILKNTVSNVTSEIQRCVTWAPDVKPPARQLEADRLAEAYMAARSRWVLQLSGEEKRTRRKLKKKARLSQQATGSCDQTVQGIEETDQKQPESTLLGD